MTNNTGSNMRNKNEEYSKTIANNIRKILKFRNWSQFDLCNKLNEYGLSITQNSLSKYIPKDNKQITMPISLVILCCKIFDISLEKITSPDYSPAKENDNKTLNNIENSLDNEFDFIDYLAAGIEKASNKFVVNCNDDAFNGYNQIYYCYFYPTISSENHLLTAELEFKNENHICKAYLKLNTGKYTKNGDIIYKYYKGLMVIVEKTKSCYCILLRQKASNTNELCFLNFRYIPISDIHRKLDCRMVEVLTTSAGGDSSFPTAHRMFISREPIKKEHIDYILPHLYLNNSMITIEENGLIKTACISNQYKEVIEKIISLLPTSDLGKNDLSSEMISSKSQIDSSSNTSIQRVMYLLKEDLVRNTASLYLQKSQIQLFISKLRSNAYAFRFNKVSKKLDDNIRKMLLNLGYYTYGKKIEIHKETK